MKISENIFRNLSDDQKRQLESNSSPEEVLRLVKETGIELTPDQLESISGGWGDGKPHCEPGQHDYQYKGLQPSPTASGVFALYVCSKCGDGILE